MADRDERGHFIKGHPALNIQPGKNVGGRKKSVAGLYKDALKQIDDALPQLMNEELQIAEVMRGKALKGDIKAAQVFHDIRKDFTDRIYGKPNLPITGAGGLPLPTATFIMMLPDGTKLKYPESKP